MIKCTLPIFVMCCVIACNNNAPTGVIESAISQQTDEPNPFILGNKKIVELENEEIELFLKRYKWKMTKTGTGLRYELTKKGTGNIFEIGETVTLEYQTCSLSGEMIYNSKVDGLIRFAVDKSEAIAGLHEAAKLMNKGSEMRLIIPSHLAYGASGDGNKIKPYQTLVVKIKTV